MSKYFAVNMRICRLVGLTSTDRRKVIEFMICAFGLGRRMLALLTLSDGSKPMSRPASSDVATSPLCCRTDFSAARPLAHSARARQSASVVRERRSEDSGRRQPHAVAVTLPKRSRETVKSVVKSAAADAPADAERLGHVVGADGLCDSTVT
jgi:hypothetical protein